MVTLFAGACTSIITYLVHYELKKALWILLLVLVLFYILGTVVQRIIYKFELQVEKEETEKAEQEGKVVEKDVSIPEGTDVPDESADAPYGEKESPEEESGEETTAEDQA